MSRTRWFFVCIFVAVAIAAIIFSRQNPSPTSTTSGSSEEITMLLAEKSEFLNTTAQRLNATSLLSNYCTTHPQDKLCETTISLHIPEFQHHDMHVQPEVPTTSAFPEPCNMLCLTWELGNEIDIVNRGPDPITALVVTVSVHNGLAESTPVWLGVIDPSKTITIPLMYGNGLPVGLIVYYP